MESVTTMLQHQPTNTTTTDEPEDAPDTTVILLMVILLIITGLSGTVIVITTILKSPRIKLRQQGFIVSLAFADLTFLGVVMPFVAASIANGYSWILGDGACEFVGYLAGTCVQASAANISLVAFNRYFSIVHFRHYKSVFTKRNMIFMLLVTWLYAGLIGLPSFFGFGQFIYLDYIDICMYDWSYSTAHRIYIGVMVFILPLLLTGYFYIHILITVLKSKQKLRNNAGNATSNVPVIKREEVRLTVQLILIFSWFVFCWSPFLILAIIIDPYGELDRLVYDITVNLMVLNSVINPFVYFFSNKTLRQEVRLILCCKSKSVVHVQHTTATRTET